MENIGNFLSACEAYGVPKSDMFQTVDLYEGQNIPQVADNNKIVTMYSFVEYRLCRKHDLSGINEYNMRLDITSCDHNNYYAYYSIQVYYCLHMLLSGPSFTTTDPLDLIVYTVAMIGESQLHSGHQWNTCIGKKSSS